MHIYLQILGAALPKIKPEDLPQTGTGPHAIQNIRDVLFAIIGAMTLLVIVVSGLRYIVSAGDPQKAIKARNGVIYALVGMVIALFADALVSYVATRVGQ